jgi:hypothetical protein
MSHIRDFLHTVAAMLCLAAGWRSMARRLCGAKADE